MTNSSHSLPANINGVFATRLIMTNNTQEWNAIEEALRAVGLSADSRLRSTGIAMHRKRWQQGQASGKILARYADDLHILSILTQAQHVALPVDFWDARTPVMQAVGLDEYALVHALAALPYQPYVSFLARCYGHLEAFKQNNNATTAVATVLMLLRESANYVRGEHPLVMTATRPRLSREQQAIFLWQQVATGTNRQIPHLHRDAYTHSYWARFNVVEMWHYHTGTEIGVDAVWGLSGFHPGYIRDPKNTNQIEHLTISALSQTVLHIPPFLLNVVENAQWLLHESSLESARADKAVNRAVARHFLPYFTLQNPQPACNHLLQALSQQP